MSDNYRYCNYTTVKRALVNRAKNQSKKIIQKISKEEKS